MKQPGSAIPRRVALVTAGFDQGGGIRTIARWLRDSLHSTGRYVVDVHDLAASSRDTFSRRLAAPPSWLRSTLRSASGVDGVTHWGANGVEIEAMRYRPRQELTRALQSYDIIQIVSGGPALAAAAIKAGVPTVLAVATSMAWERQQKMAEQTGPTGLWRRGMTALTIHTERYALRMVDVVLVMNSTMLEYVRSVRPKHFAKAYPGVDTANFSPPTAGWRHGGHLLSTCRWDDPRKGLDRMIQAYAYMVEADSSVPQLVLAWRGQLPDALQSLIRSLGLSSRITVCSELSRHELTELYRTASVFLQTSYEEGLGMSVLEAMGCGLPVVATETAGTKESVVNGVTGWLIPQDASVDVPRMVADRALDVLRGDGSILGARGRDRCVATFSTAVAVRRFTDTYDQLLARGTA